MMMFDFEVAKAVGQVCARDWPTSLRWVIWCLFEDDRPSGWLCVEALACVIEVGPDAFVGVYSGVQLEVVVAGGEWVEALVEVVPEDGFRDAADTAVGVGDVDLCQVGETEGIVGGDNVGE